MLQDNRPIASNRTNLGAAEFSSPAELLDSFVHFLRQQYLIILVTSLLTIALGGIYLVVARPSYTAVATMLIDTRKAQFLQQQPSYSDAQVDSASIESQLRVLQSDDVALAVIKKLQLTDDPEFIGTASNSGSAYDHMRTALTALKSRLEVRRDALSYIIEVRFYSHDAEKAARIANAIVDAYIVDQLDAKYQSTLRASNWLEDRIRDLRDKASAAEQAVVDYQRDHNIVVVDKSLANHNVVDPAGKTASEQRVGELNSQLLVARERVAEARAKLDRIQAVLTSDSAGAIDTTVADALNNDVVSKLRSQYLDLSSKEHDWAARYGNDHLAVVNLRNQMAEINAAIVDQVKQIAGTYKSNFEIEKQHADEAQKAYDEAVAQAEQNNQSKVVLNDLVSKAKTYRDLYENFLQRYMESVQEQSFPITEARLISPALRPLAKSSPKTLLTLVICAAAGIILGLAIGVFRDLWDRVFRTTEQAENLLQVPCIALVPRLKVAGPALSAAEQFEVDPEFAPSGTMAAPPITVSNGGWLPDDVGSAGRPAGSNGSICANAAVESPNFASSMAASSNEVADLSKSIAGDGVATVAADAPDPANTAAASSNKAADPLKPAAGGNCAAAAGTVAAPNGASSAASSNEAADPATPTAGGNGLAADVAVASPNPASDIAASSDDAGHSVAASNGAASDAAAHLRQSKKDRASPPNDADDHPSPAQGGNPRTLVHDENVLWTTVDSPFSRYTESLRVLKVAVDLREIVRSNKVIAFTSSLPNEGKSTLSAGLALMIAQAGGRAILVDCDLRNPSLSQTLAPSATAGFIEVVSDKATIDDVLWQSDPKINLSFLPTVLKSRVAHTSEILASAATRKLFDELRKRYEYIIVDLSPLAPVVDVRTTAHFVDSYVCVIEWGRTKIDVVRKALADAPGVYQNLIGTVLNKADITKLSRYDAHRGEYYYNKHYARYGYVD
ncbi:MAG: polysaccharide biosynthesis tyrosine autokinase [Xanthobacteraceae bacterium]